MPGMGARQTTAGQHGWKRYVALGDSFTEGMCDPDPTDPQRWRGWCDRLAAELAARNPDGLQYANVAVRGRLLPEILSEQLPVALDARADLVSLVGGGNDVLRPAGDPDRLAASLEEAVVRLRSVGATVLLATGADPRATPLIRRTRERSPSSTPTSGRSPRGRAPTSSTCGACGLCRTPGCGRATGSTSPRRDTAGSPCTRWRSWGWMRVMTGPRHWTRRRPVDGERYCGTTHSGFTDMSRRGWHAGCAAGPPATRCRPNGRSCCTWGDLRPARSPRLAPSAQSA